MERYTEMKEYIEDYRYRRKREKREYLNSHYSDILTPLLAIEDKLIQDVEKKQTINNQGKIKYLIFQRLLSSGYTGSYEISIAMSNASLYLDEDMACIYWKPELIYLGLEGNMKQIRQILNNKYLRIEEYELMRLKQYLLLDDWKILCEILEKMAVRLAEKMKDSSLKLEDEIELLCGDYMDRLDVFYTIQTDNLTSSDNG